MQPINDGPKGQLLVLHRRADGPVGMHATHALGRDGRASLFGEDRSTGTIRPSRALGRGPRRQHLSGADGTACSLPVYWVAGWAASGAMSSPVWRCSVVV